MAYTNGVFHIDFVNGNDAARTALTDSTASNPSGTITRINKTAHGLVTGAVVDLTLFTSWLNGPWKITVVDADNFDLDNAVWQTTADPNGTVTPRGGADWADAWQTIDTGATALRIQPGDKMKIAKTADPVSFAINATWTDGSKAVTLASALSKKVEDAVSGWTGATHITIGVNSSRKIGASAVTIAPQASFTTGKMAFKAIAGGGSQDFSAYTHINFWIRPTANIALAANTYNIILCSDATGDTPVNTFTLPAMVDNTSWQPVSIDLGGAMGASIQSVAIWAILDPGTTGFSINNIYASGAELSLKNLIGKNNEVFYSIQSVDDLTVNIDSNSQSASGQGYSGATSTETLYYRVPLLVNQKSSSWQLMNEAGNSTIQKNHYEGGWNTSTDVLDGITAISNSVKGLASPISFQTYSKLSNFLFANFSSNTTAAFIELENVIYNSCSTAISVSNLIDSYFKNVKFLNSSSTPSCGGSVTFENCEFRNNSVGGVNTSPGQNFLNCTFANNSTSSIVMPLQYRIGEGATLMRNCVIEDSTEFSAGSSQTGFVWSFDHDNTPGNHWGFTAGGTINWQTTVKEGAAVGSWRVNVSGSIRAIFQPVYFRLAEIAVSASSLVTVNVWVKKDHATNIGAAIYVEDAIFNISGVVASTATKANDTDWEELTLTFTPTEAGIVPIYASAFYVAGTSDAYFGPITVTQA